MARITPTIPIATVNGDDPELSIADADWHRVETAYGRKLLPDVRKEVYEETRKMLWFAKFEQTAQPVSPSRRRVERIKKAAHEFHMAIFEDFPNAKSKYYSNHLVNRSLSDARIKDRDKLRFLGVLMTSVVVACNRALSQLDSPTKRGWRKGEAWQSWVQRLTSILVARGLPTEARKDTDKNNTGNPSPFVAFIRELQACIPANFRWSTQSCGALAKSIYEARAQVRRDPKPGNKRINKSRKKRTE